MFPSATTGRNWNGWKTGILHYLCPNVAKEGMEIIFNEKYLQEMYLTGQTDKKHRYQPQVVRKYVRVIDIMIDATYRAFAIQLVEL